MSHQSHHFPDRFFFWAQSSSQQLSAFSHSPKGRRQQSENPRTLRKHFSTGCWKRWMRAIRNQTPGRRRETMQVMRWSDASCLERGKASRATTVSKPGSRRSHARASRRVTFYQPRPGDTHERNLTPPPLHPRNLPAALLLPTATLFMPKVKGRKTLMVCSLSLSLRSPSPGAAPDGLQRSP